MNHQGMESPFERPVADDSCHLDVVGFRAEFRGSR